MFCNFKTLFSPSGEILPEETLFTYPVDSGPANFSFPDHLPAFLEDIVENVPQEIRDACGDDPQCIFDYSETGNEEIGMETLNTNMENENDQIQACKAQCDFNTFADTFILLC